MMGKRLYIGNLPFEITEANLQELFSSCGRIESVKIIIDKGTGRSKGFGFVEMATELESQAAIGKMNGSMVGSRAIVVNEARPMENRKNGKPGKRGGEDRSGLYGRRWEGGARGKGSRRKSDLGAGNRSGFWGHHQSEDHHEKRKTFDDDNFGNR
jgi:cold-inducible RNA-binding protein